MIYYISKNYNTIKSAGGKAKTDIEKIMCNIGYKNAGLPQTRYRNKIKGYFITLASVIKASFTIGKGDILILQYPFKKYYTFLCKITHCKGGKTITFIHDLGTFRRKKITAEQEIKKLNRSDYIITHNKRMSNWLINKGIKAKLGEQEILDFLSDAKSPNKNGKSANNYIVVYAGALSHRKNEFLYQLEDYANDYSLSLYGAGFDKTKVKNQDKLACKGFVMPEELIANVNGDFGLIWDGNTLDGCYGDWGEYLKINHPHKTSLYLRCGLPVIIWKEAALSDFIEKNNIGICINSLRDLNAILSALSKEDYRKMLSNVKIVSEKLAEGYYTAEALQKGVREISLPNE